MGTLDYIVIALFAIAMIGIVVWVFKQKQKSSGDFFLAGRDATWLAIGASIFASNIGSEHLIGLAGAGASSGMAMAHWEIQGWMILILGWVFVPFYSRSMVLTMPEFLERRYNKESRTILSVISLVSYVLTKVAVTVYAGGLVFKEVFGIQELWGIDFFWIAAIGLVLLTALYTVIGGMKSVLYTSVLQTPILLIGSLVILVLSLKAVGGWDQVLEACRVTPVNEYGDSMINLIRSNRDANFPWLGVFIGSSVIGFWYWCTDQFIVQRVLSGKDETQARRGAIFGAYLKLTPVFLFLIPGMVAFAMQKHGITVNGETFTMSSADKKYRPKASEKTLLYVGRVATVVVVVLGILWIPVMKSVGSVLYNYLQDVQSVLAPGIAAAFLLGICSKKATPKGGMWGLIAGFIICITRLGAKVYYTSGATFSDSWFKYLFYDTNWLFFCGGMLLFCMLVIVVVSRFTTPAPAEQIVGLTFGSTTDEQKAVTRASWNKWDVIHSAIIILITVVFYWYFW